MINLLRTCILHRKFTGCAMRDCSTVVPHQNAAYCGDEAFYCCFMARMAGSNFKDAMEGNITIAAYAERA